MLVTFNEILNSSFLEKIIISFMKAIFGLVIVFFLFKIVDVISKKIRVKLSMNSRVDETIVAFISPLISKVIKFFIIVMYIGFVGIETTSIGAAITSAGLAIGLALQGSLSNFAGGFVILLMRPFKVGDYISSCNYEGSVESIQIFYTTLITIDNEVIKIPNGEVASSIIIDYTSKKKRRVDLLFLITYKKDIELAKKVIRECIDKTRLAIEEDKIFINVFSQNDKYIEITSRVWVKTQDYWDMYYLLMESVLLGFNEYKIETPYSKMDVKFIKDNNKSV